MFDFSILSTKYKVKKMGEEDVPIIFNLLSGNPLYFEYCPPKPSTESVLNDLRALPPEKKLNDKFYLGFFNDNQLVAVMDYIVSFPQEDTIFIGLFMVDIKESGKGIGSSIIDEALNVFKREGYVKVRLAYMKGNTQSSRFWQKCGFAETGIEKENEHGLAVVLEKII